MKCLIIAKTIGVKASGEKGLQFDKTKALSEIFIGFTGDSVAGLKEKYGDDFSWDELKMYKASLG